MFSSLANPTLPPSIEDVVGKKIANGLPGISRNFRLKRDAARAKANLGVARNRAEAASEDSERARSDSEVSAAEESLAKTENALKSDSVRPLPVYEHPPLLSYALQNSKSRLLIISPWIRKAVVDREFMAQLLKLVEAGVAVHIGYGLGEDDRGARPEDKKVESELSELARSHKNFAFHRLGDTHAKVLILDQEFFVISSFNWLSFRGDQNRTFREEWGTYVGVPGKVDDFYKKMLERF